MSIQTLEMFGNQVCIGQMESNKITLFPWERYSTDAKTGDEVHVIYFPDQIKCSVGSQILQRDICGHLVFIKISQSKISSIDYHDIPGVVEYMISDISSLTMDEKPNESDKLFDEIVNDIKSQEYYDYFEMVGYESY